MPRVRELGCCVDREGCHACLGGLNKRREALDGEKGPGQMERRQRGRRTAMTAVRAVRKEMSGNSNNNRLQQRQWKLLQATPYVVLVLGVCCCFLPLPCGSFLHGGTGSSVGCLRSSPGVIQGSRQQHLTCLMSSMPSEVGQQQAPPKREPPRLLENLKVW